MTILREISDAVVEMGEDEISALVKRVIDEQISLEDMQRQ